MATAQNGGSQPSSQPNSWTEPSTRNSSPTTNDTTSDTRFILILHTTIHGSHVYPRHIPGINANLVIAMLPKNASFYTCFGRFLLKGRSCSFERINITQYRHFVKACLYKPPILIPAFVQPRPRGPFWSPVLYRSVSITYVNLEHDEFDQAHPGYAVPAVSHAIAPPPLLPLE